MAEPRRTDCCIVGAGPAGVTLGLLLARQGVGVTLLESHYDFDRDFRGDTLQPSTLDFLDQIGLAEAFLQLPHNQVHQLTMRTHKGLVVIYDARRLRTKYPFVVMMPQVRFLEFLVERAGRYPSFRLLMGARAEELVEERGDVRGVRYQAQDGWHEVRAALTVGADGRFSKVRQLARLAMERGALVPMDLLWFRLPARAQDTLADAGLYSGVGHYLVALDRKDEWQIGYGFPKGGYRRLRAAGIEELRKSIGSLAPWLADRTRHLQDWRQTSLLVVEAARARRWYRPGLLLLGDAAHVMLPAGGVGINLAIQEAIVAANLLGPALKLGSLTARHLAAVQRRRQWPAQLIQRLQSLQLEQLLAGADQQRRPSLAARLVAQVPMLRNLRGRLYMYGGFRPERVA